MYHDYYNMHMMHFGLGGLYLSNKNTILGIRGANGSGQPQNSILIHPGANQGVKLYHGGNLKFETAGIGASVYGTLVATGADINGDLDVDGHTNLDNVSVAGVTTFAGNTYVNDSFTINDTGSSTPLSVLGNFGTGDTVYIQNNNSGGHVRF
ncbi:MAG: hypothetical protein VXY93_20870, partial [Pseudomonadota bacterium]|nr:hypothetical protein [Pseudomonadota bacterium]